jgi:hypothetical protein
MTCSEFDILLCDFIDGTLDAGRTEAFRAHRDSCAACGELARDAAGAVEFIARAEEVSIPPAVLTRIAFDIPSGKSAGSGIWGWISGRLRPVLQPRFAMGMAMTILSFSMLGRFAGIEVRQLKPSDLNPVNVWAAADDRLHRAWERGVKYYESLRVVYEVQSKLKEWNEQEEEERKAQVAGQKPATAASPASETTPVERKETDEYVRESPRGTSGSFLPDMRNHCALHASGRPWALFFATSTCPCSRPERRRRMKTWRAPGNPIRPTPLLTRRRSRRKG